VTVQMFREQVDQRQRELEKPEQKLGNLLVLTRCAAEDAPGHDT
jgi:hypothetical protein